MIRKIILFNLLILLISCGKDVVIIEDPIVPDEGDEIFEVNLIGFTTDENRSFIPNGMITIDGKNVVSDEFGFFHLDKVLIGRKGKVTRFQKDGFLPSYARIVNHQSLEQIVLNLKMIGLPNAVMISESGGIIEEEDGRLIVDNQDFETSTDIIFKTFAGKLSNGGIEDQLYLSSQKEILLKEASLYVSGSSPLKANAELEVSLDIEVFRNKNISELSVFYFDESELTWKQHNVAPTISGDDVFISINKYGWWTIAEKVPAQYATINLTQLNDVAVNNAEVDLSYGLYSGSTFYTSNAGSISTYYPADIAITASLNNEQYKADFSNGFNTGINKGIIHFQEEIQTPFEGKVYDCDFTFSNGYVAVLTEGQHKIFATENGVFSGETFRDDTDVTLRFYTDDYIFSNKKDTDVASLQNDNINFFSCGNLDDKLVVTDGLNLFQDFDMCRIKERPNETVVIGERSNSDVFLVSFVGEKEGVYEGLFYYPEILDDVKSEVMVNIVLYDKVENKVGGFINTEYISSGEELSISFIGNIE